MTEDDLELRDLMGDWQSDEPETNFDPAAILRQVKRRSLGLKLLAGGEILLVAGALAGLELFALRHPDPLNVAVMSTFSLLALGALAFAFWNRRGLWGPVTETTAAYLALALARARRRQKALRVSRWLLAVEVALFFPWIGATIHPPSGEPALLTYVEAYGFLALVAGTMAAAIVGLERWTRRELAALESLGE